MEYYEEVMEYLISIPNVKLNFKNEEELRSLISNIEYINNYMEEKMGNEINEFIEIYFEEENKVKIKTSEESFQLYIMNEEEIIQFMIDHFDDFFRLYFFSPSFLYFYFSDERYSKLYIRSEKFMKKIIECCCEDDDLHQLLKNGIRDLNHFVQHIIDVDGIDHCLNGWNEEYYYHDSYISSNYDIFTLRFDD